MTKQFAMKNGQLLPLALNLIAEACEAVQGVKISNTNNGVRIAGLGKAVNLSPQSWQGAYLCCSTDMAAVPMGSPIEIGNARAIVKNSDKGCRCVSLYEANGSKQPFALDTDIEGATNQALAILKGCQTQGYLMLVEIKASVSKGDKASKPKASKLSKLDVAIDAIDA